MDAAAPAAVVRPSIVHPSAGIILRYLPCGLGAENSDIMIAPKMLKINTQVADAEGEDDVPGQLDELGSSARLM